MRKMSKIYITSTVIQCEDCRMHILSPLDELPEKCPHCKKETEFSITRLNWEDSRKFIEYIKQEG